MRYVPKRVDPANHTVIEDHHRNIPSNNFHRMNPADLAVLKKVIKVILTQALYFVSYY